jgi:choline dehydrogenase-like flavoprotein
MLKTYKDITKDIIEHPDVCIIGSGAGGAVVADILCSAGVDVVMLEEGGYYTKDKYKEFNPVDSFKYLYRDYGATITYGFVIDGGIVLIVLFFYLPVKRELY